MSQKTYGKIQFKQKHNNRVDSSKIYLIFYSVQTYFFNRQFS